MVLNGYTYKHFVIVKNRFKHKINLTLKHYQIGQFRKIYFNWFKSLIRRNQLLICDTKLILFINYVKSDSESYQNVCNMTNTEKVIITLDQFDFIFWLIRINNQFCIEEDNICHFFLLCPKFHKYWNAFLISWNEMRDIDIAADKDFLVECIIFIFHLLKIF